MKTPEEIKKGLYTHTQSNKCAPECPYAEDESFVYECIHNMCTDALAYIQQLEAQLEQVTRERDAAVRDLREADRISCEHCIAYIQYSTNCDEADYICDDCDKTCRCRTCRNNSNWQWRGVEVE